ncbi:MAG TPA: dolichol-phosphate mannosyltransferase [Elusimicrobia bacterium]|nr:dolichol-phosphate mannosyltransferase [Elusimicrobiota bacterium]HBT60275.1 dolichol-phosphate mannosyltransferase [Elusimicrobiota bacterium]
MAQDAPALVSVVVPAYNEKENILPLIKEIRQALAAWRHEILVVDDSSPDGTAALVQTEFAGEPAVRVIVRRQDPGLAKSIREGLEQARGDAVVVMDSDFNHEPRYLPIMVDALRHYDGVFGSRFLYGGKMAPLSRHLLSWCFNMFVRLATGGDITDSLYGFFAIRREVMARCDFNLIFWGYGDYCIRLLYYLQRHKAALLQIPIVNGQRRGGTGNSAFLKVFAQYTHATLRLAWEGRLESKHT